MFANIIDKTYSKIPLLPRIHQNKRVQLITLLSFLAFLTALLVLRDLFAINIHKFIFLALIIVASILLNKKNAISMLLFILPFSPNLAESYILVYVAAYFGLVSLKHLSIKQIIVIVAVPLVLFVDEIVLSSIYGTISFGMAGRILLLTAILALVFYDRTLFCKQHIYAFFLGCIYMFVFISINWFAVATYASTHKNPESYQITFKLMFENVRLGDNAIAWIEDHGLLKYPYHSVMNLKENPNNIGLLTIVGLSSCLCLFGTATKKEKWINFAIFVLLLLFGLWSQSRTFVLLFPTLLLLFLICSVVIKRKSLLTAALYVTTAVLIIAIILIADRDAFKVLFGRFFDPDVGSGGKRFELIKRYFEFMFSNWKYALFGVSCFNLQDMAGIENVPHTNFVQFMCAYGLITFAAFVAFIIIAFIKSKKVAKKEYAYLFFPLVFTVGFTFTLQLFLPSIILISFIPPMIALSFMNKGISEEKAITYYSVRPSTLDRSVSPSIAVCAESFGGGIGSYIINMSDALLEKKYNLSLVFDINTTDEQKNKYSNIECTKISYQKKQPKLRIVKFISKYRHYLKSFEELKPDLIYINSSYYKRSLALILAALRHKASFVVLHSHHGVNIKTKLKFSERFLRWFIDFGNYSRFACSLESGKSFFGKSFGKSDNDAVIPNFIDAEKFKFSLEKRQEMKNEFQIKQNELVLGTVGRICEDKNQKFLVELISKLPNKYKLFIAGDGPLKDEVAKQIQYLGVENRVILSGNRNDVDKVYCAFDVFCLPSNIEGSPFASIEAQCSGLITVVSADLSRSIKISENVIFLPLDVETWKNLIVNIKELDAEKRAEGYETISKTIYSSPNGKNEICKKIENIVYE